MKNETYKLLIEQITGLLSDHETNRLKVFFAIGRAMHVYKEKAKLRKICSAAMMVASDLAKKGFPKNYNYFYDAYRAMDSFTGEQRGTLISNKVTLTDVRWLLSVPRREIIIEEIRKGDRVWPYKLKDKASKARNNGRDHADSCQEESHGVYEFELPIDETWSLKFENLLSRFRGHIPAICERFEEAKQRVEKK